MVDVIVTRRTVLPFGVLTCIGLCLPVPLAVFVRFPESAVLEAPEGVERIALHITIHHVFIVTRAVELRHKVLRSDVDDLLSIMRDGERCRPLEILLLYVARLDGKFKTLVGYLTKVGQTGIVTCLVSDLHFEEKVGGT